MQEFRTLVQIATIQAPNEWHDIAHLELTSEKRKHTRRPELPSEAAQF